MKNSGTRLALAGAIAFFAFFVVQSTATTITFSESGLAPGNTLTNQLASYGVLFSVSNGTIVVSNSWTPPAGSTITGQYVAVNSTISSTGQATVAFVSPSDPSVNGWVNGASISFDLWDTNATPSPRVTVNAYDMNAVLLGTFNLTSEYVNAANPFSGNVHSLVFVDDGGDGHVIDNLSFGDITVVPEPGTFVLLGAGLMVVSLARRFRKRV
jgi:hypothetical protein